MNPTVASGKVVLVDPAFSSDRIGHHWRLNTGYADLFGRERCWFATHETLTSAEGIEADRIIGAFSTSYYDAAEVERLGRLGVWLQGLAYRDHTPLPRQARALLQEILKRRRRSAPGFDQPRAAASSIYHDDLARLIDQAGFSADDHLVFTSLDARMGQAVLELIAERGLSRLPALHLRLMYDDATRTDGGLDYISLIERIAATGQIGPRLTLHCETSRHAAGLSRRLGKAVGVAPFPAAPLAPPADPDGRRLTVSFLGEARAEKGFDLIEPILEAFETDHPDLADQVVWRIHAGGRSIESSAARDVVRARARNRRLNVHYRFGVRSPADYEAMRAEADLVLALQDPAVYALRGSGIAQEAVAGGRPIVCRPGTSIAAEPGGALIAASTPRDIANAVARIVRHPEPWFDRARRGAGLFRRRLQAGSLLKACDSSTPSEPDPPVALLVGPWWPQGGSARLMAMQAEQVSALGFQVVRVHLARPGEAEAVIQSQAMRGPRRDLDVVRSIVVAAGPGATGAWEASPVPPMVTAMLNQGRVGLIVANFPQTAGWVARLNAPNDPVRVMETHDLRLDPATGEILTDPASPPPGFDAAIFVNAGERDHWARAGQTACVLITPPIDDRAASSGDNRAPSFDLLFVGSDHARNRAALRRLHDEILDHPDMADVSLLVVGDMAAVEAAQRPNTTILGPVEDLEMAYGATRLVVAPHGGDGGLPSKVLGAMARGRPLIADAGAVAFLKSPHPFAVDDAEAFRRAIRRALDDPRYRRRLAAASHRAWTQIAAPGRYRRDWERLLGALKVLPRGGSRHKSKRV